MSDAHPTNAAKVVKITDNSLWGREEAEALAEFKRSPPAGCLHGDPVRHGSRADFDRRDPTRSHINSYLRTFPDGSVILALPETATSITTRTLFYVRSKRSKAGGAWRSSHTLCFYQAARDAAGRAVEGSVEQDAIVYLQVSGCTETDKLVSEIIRQAS